MAILSRTYGYLFVMVPRTGCTSIAEGVLLPHLDGRYFPPEDVRDGEGELVVPRKHSTVGEITGNGLMPVEEAKALFKFCTVRNPFDSLVSLYTKLKDRYVPLLDDPDAFIHDKPQMMRDMRYVADHSFPEWIDHKYRDACASPRSFYGSYVKNVDHIMRFERLQADFDHLCTYLGTPRFEIPRVNRIRPDDDLYRAHYTPTARRIVEEAFRPDLERFDYSF